MSPRHPRRGRDSADTRSARFSLLPHSVAEALAACPLSTRLSDPSGWVPPGHRRLVTTRALQRRDFEQAAEELMGWRMHTGAGLRVGASHAQASPGTVVRLSVEVFGRSLGITVGCKVIDAISEQDRRGFTYATLAGHLESGVQSFIVSRDSTGAISASVVSVSAPARGLLRLAGPLPVWAQRVMATRYCAAMDQPSDLAV